MKQRTGSTFYRGKEIPINATIHNSKEFGEFYLSGIGTEFRIYIFDAKGFANVSKNKFNQLIESKN